MSSSRVLAVSLGALLLLLACTREAARKPVAESPVVEARAAQPEDSSATSPDALKAGPALPDPSTPEAPREALPEELLDQLAVFAAEYRSWKKVDDLAYWAPQLCRRPLPPQARESKSTDEQTHGRKFYYLYAKDRDGYLAGGERAEAVGQVVVKESFATASAAAAQRGDLDPDFDNPYGLFVMWRVDPQTPGTDDGWIYATFPAWTTRTEAAGRLQSCMDCHVREGRGRLFGMAEAERAILATTPKPASLDRTLADIPRLYKQWSRVDQQVRVSPADCMMPDPGEARISESEDDATHGRKLYYLYARDRAGYVRGGRAAGGVGQIVVKEAWQPVPSERAGGHYALDPETHLPLTTELAGKRYEPGAPAGLFVMLRLDPKTPNTDDGWVYATYPPGSETASEAGRIESCMKCHARASGGRLFGLKRY